MNDSIVAINITARTQSGRYELLQKSKTPLLFYWNGEGDLSDAICKTEGFEEYVWKSDILHTDRYTYATVNSVFYNDVNDQHKEQSASLQDVLKLKDISEARNIFWLHYLSDIFKELYAKGAGHEWQDPQYRSIGEQVVLMYNELQEKYPKKFVKSSVLNYFRSQLIKKYLMSQENSQWCVDQLDKILIN